MLNLFARARELQKFNTGYNHASFPKQPRNKTAMARPQIRKSIPRIFNKSKYTAGTLLCSADFNKSYFKRAISGFDTAQLKRSLQGNCAL